MILDMAATANLIIWGATAWVCAITFTALALPIVGYAIGRYRPLHRAITWAHWQMYGPLTGWRKTVVWVLLSAENIGLLLLHPVQGWRAWQHRHDPPPPRSSAMTFTHVDRSGKP